jgi:hypothetical protein
MFEGFRLSAFDTALWGRKGFLEEHYDVLNVWRRWAEEV